MKKFTYLFTTLQFYVYFTSVLCTQWQMTAVNFFNNKFAFNMVFSKEDSVN